MATLLHDQYQHIKSVPWSFFSLLILSFLHFLSAVDCQSSLKQVLYGFTRNKTVAAKATVGTLCLIKCNKPNSQFWPKAGWLPPGPEVHLLSGWLKWTGGTAGGGWNQLRPTRNFELVHLPLLGTLKEKLLPHRVSVSSVYTIYIRLFSK